MSEVWAGEIVGESALFGVEGVRTATLRAETESWLLCLRPELLDRIRGTSLEAALQRHILQVMLRRLSATDLGIRKAWAAQVAAEQAPKAPPPSTPRTLRERLAQLFGGGR